jgi:hypothetical protein
MPSRLNQLREVNQPGGRWNNKDASATRGRTCEGTATGQVRWPSRALTAVQNCSIRVQARPDARTVLLVGVVLRRIDRGREVGGRGAARLFAFRPVQLLEDLLLGVAALEQRLLGTQDHVRVAADVRD